MSIKKNSFNDVRSPQFHSLLANNTPSMFSKGDLFNHSSQASASVDPNSSWVQNLANQLSTTLFQTSESYLSPQVLKSLVEFLMSDFMLTLSSDQKTFQSVFLYCLLQIFEFSLQLLDDNIYNA